MKLLSLIEAVKNTLSSVESFIDFIKKRAAGAAKIAESAEKKGGYSLLTAVHFKAKAAPYKDILKHADKENKTEYIRNKAKAVYEKLADWESMSQNEFQKQMGILEVYGELFIKSKGK